MDTVKILVVDDEDRMRKLVRDYLSREGYKILEAADGEQALKVLDKYRTDLDTKIKELY